MHDSIENAMNDFSKNIPTLSLEKTEEQLALFIEEWVVLHVINEDNKIAQWNSKNQKVYVIDDEIAGAEIDIEKVALSPVELK